MISIYKYTVHGNGVLNRITCRRKKLLDIQEQNGELVCWIEVDDDLPETTTELVGLGTGWHLDKEDMYNLGYRKTVQDAAGFVWHFYEQLGLA